MTSLLQILLLPFHRLRLRAAERRHQAAPGRESTLRYATALSAAGRHQEGLELLNQLRRSSPSDEALRDALKQVRRRQAGQMLVRAMADHRSQPTVETSVRVAHLLKATGKPDAALRLISPLVESNPHHSGLLRALGTIYLERHQRSQAEADLHSAIEHLQASLNVAPNDRKTLMNLAIARCSAGQLREAIPLIDTTLAAHPGDRRAQRLRAICQNALRASPGPSGRSSQESGREQGEERQVSQEQSARMDRIFEQESVRGVFAIARDGSVRSSQTRPSTIFNFDDQAAALKSLAAASRFDGERIGIGPVHSCIVTGDQWQVAVLPHTDINIIAFCESGNEESGTESWFDQELTKPVETHA